MKKFIFFIWFNTLIKRNKFLGTNILTLNTRLRNWFCFVSLPRYDVTLYLPTSYFSRSSWNMYHSSDVLRSAAVFPRVVALFFWPGIRVGHLSGPHCGVETTRGSPNRHTVAQGCALGWITMGVPLPCISAERTSTRRLVSLNTHFIDVLVAKIVHARKSCKQSRKIYQETI